MESQSNSANDRIKGATFIQLSNDLKKIPVKLHAFKKTKMNIQSSLQAKELEKPSLLSKHPLFEFRIIP